MDPVSLIFDLAVAAVIVLFALVYLRRGFLSALLDFLGSLVALVVSAFVASHLSTAVFEGLFRASLEQRTAETLAGQQTVDVAEIITRLFGFLPEELVQSLADTLGQSMDYSAANLATEIVSKVIAPLVIPIISLIVFLILFALLRILLAFLSTLVKGVNMVPLVGQVNRVLGFCVGALVGVVYCLLFLCVVWAFDAGYAGGTLEAQYLSNSFVARLLAPFNFFR